MQTALTPEQGPVFAPVSPAIAKLLHQLQEQILIEASAHVADPFEPLGERIWSRNKEGGGYRFCSVTFAHGEVRMQAECCPDPEFASRRRGVWYGNEVRHDAAGRAWTRSMGDHVIDDFGTLVPVPEVLQ